MGRKQAVTYQDIAEYTGFSKATISRYFNDRDSLTLEKQDTISEALKKLDYRQNKVARVLANGKTEMVGILLPDLYHHFYYQILNKILGTYREFGFKFLVFNGDHNEEVERRYLQELMAYKVEGMIVLSNTLSSEELARHSNRGDRTGGQVDPQYYDGQLSWRADGRRTSQETGLYEALSHQFGGPPGIYTSCQGQDSRICGLL